MNLNRLKRVSRAVAATAALLVVSTAAPALAHNGDDHTTPPKPGAYTSKAQVVEASLHDLPVGPLTVATWPTGPAHAVLTGSQHLLDFGVLEANAAGSYDEGWVSADAAVASIKGGVGDLVSIDLGAITSQCRSDQTGQTGSVSFAGGSISVLGYPALKLPLNPAPNTKLSIPGLLDVVLNEQKVNADGSLTVTALDVHGSPLLQTLLLTMHPLYLTVAQSTCDQIVPELDTPVVKGIGAVGAGASLLVFGAGAAFVVRRRRAEALAA